MKNIYIKVKSESSSGSSSEEWTRPEDWLTLPTLTEGNEKIVGLHAVWGDSDFVALLCEGAYTVDWGDGTTEDYDSGVKAEHLFDYDSLEGTECDGGYRQAIVTITPQSGNNLTTVNFQQIHSQSDLSAYYYGWLDIAIVGANVSTLDIGGTSARLSLLEQFSFIGTNLVTSFSYAFANCWALQSISSLYTGSGTDLSYMFYGCYSLLTIPLLDTSSATSFIGMFYNCCSLQTIPLLDTSSGTSLFRMFYGCYSLKTIPLLDTSSCTAFANMFYDCYSLQTIPLIDTSSGLTLASMFYNCYSLQTIPLLDTSSGNIVQSLFMNCCSLQIAKMNGTKNNVSYLNCKLSAAQLEAVFEGLATVTSKTITITGNWGVDNLTSDQLAIATDKGWTITT